MSKLLVTPATAQSLIEELRDIEKAYDTPRDDAAEAQRLCGELQDIADYASLQRALSERVGGRDCDACEKRGYEDLRAEAKRIGGSVQQVSEGIQALGWEHMAYAAGFVRRCKECRTYNASKPFKWIADIDPAKFEAWVRAHDYAFTLDALRVLLDKPADDGGGFRML